MSTGYKKAAPKEGLIFSDHYPDVSYSPEDRQKMRNYMRDKRQITTTLIAGFNWYPSRAAGDTLLRLVMPAQSRNRKHLFWQARNIENDAEPRYQSPHASKYDALITVGVYTGGKPINAREKRQVLFVTEGGMDSVALVDIGGSYRCGAVALMGVNPSEEQLKHLRILSKNFESVVFYADNDPIGLAAMAEIMAKADLPLPVSIAAPSSAKDFCAISDRQMRAKELAWVFPPQPDDPTPMLEPERTVTAAAVPTNDPDPEFRQRLLAFQRGLQWQRNTTQPAPNVGRA